MSTKSDQLPQAVTNPAKGIYAASKSTDVRGPCPMVNALANHGYLPRSGRNVSRNDFSTAMKRVGLSSFLGAMFSNPIFLEHQDPSKPSPSFLTRIWGAIRTMSVWEVLPHRLGVWPVGQTDALGQKYLNLDQLALHNAIEHDVSLSRRDLGDGNNLSPQPDLIAEILAASSDDGRTLTMSDLVALRKRRIETQKSENKSLEYGKLEHELGCGELALILKVFGDGNKVRCDFMRAFFEEERLPVDEGWEKRKWWWTLGFIELNQTVKKIKGMMGVNL